MERKADIMSELLESIEDGVASLTFNRPERLNALSTPIMDGLLNGLPRLAGDPAVKVVVLTGAGRAFCAGGDVKSMAEGGEERSAAEATTHLRSRMEVSRILHELPKPTIAMINGPAAGAGLALALACDLRIAGTSARLVTAFVRVGFSGDFGGSYFLTRLVGTAKARELYFTGRPVLGARALDRPQPDEAQHELRRERRLGRTSRYGGGTPSADRPHRGPPGGGPSVRRKAHTDLCRPLKRLDLGEACAF
jgi:2-(1,2-epoxy-1,2-dihydrophenyl)acetyl-CoA isomerase